MAPSYHVFIERPREAGDAAIARLADAVAARYGIPAATLASRLAAGRLRVKTGVERATADQFAADLATLGAVCAIVDAATGETIATAPAARPAPPAPAARPATPAPAARPATPAPAARPATPPPAFSSGLAAALSSSGSAQDLGALGSGELSLATLDGQDDRSGEAPPASFGPPEAALPASFGPPAPPPAPTGPPVDLDAPPADPFAPPDAGVEPELDVAVDVGELRARRAGSTSTAPPPGTLAPPPGAAEPVAPPVALAPGRTGLAAWIADRRLRLGAGVLVAILVGFVPAHVVASLREGSAYAEIDGELRRTYDRVVSEADWLALDGARERALARKRDKQRDIAIASLAIWAVVGGAVAFGWFRVVDWDRVADRVA